MVNRRGIAAGAVLGAAVAKRRDSDSSGDDSDDESGAKVYAMREKLLTIIADDFTIKKVRRGRRGRGKSAYICKNKVMRVRETFELQSLDGDTMYQIQERKAAIRDTMKIEDGDGETVARIKKRLVGPLRDHYHVDIKGEKDWEITGSILEHDYTIKEGGEVVATIHDKWIAPVQDTYFIDVAEGQDHALVLCCAIALDSIED